MQEPMMTESEGSAPTEASKVAASVAVEPIAAALVAAEPGEENLPLVPAGVVTSAAESVVVVVEAGGAAEATEPLTEEELEALVSVDGSAEEAEEEGVAPTLRYLGAEGPELDHVEPEGELTSFGDVLIQLVDTALELEGKGEGEELTGEAVAQIFCRGDIEDDRVVFLLLLLAQNKPVTAGLVLSAARSLGHEELVEQATIAREELQRAGDVSVEQLTAAGTFAVPVAGTSFGPSSGAEVRQ